MFELFKIFYTYKYQGLKEFIKLQLGHIKYMKFKDDTTITIFIPHYKQTIYLRRYTSDQSTFRQIFDAKEYEIDYPFIPRVIIDAGANVGLAAVYYSQRYPKANIYSIEPELSNISVLQKNIKSYNNVICLQNALHHTENKTLEILDEGLGKSGFITKSASEVKEAKSIVASVKTISVQSLMKKEHIEIIDILKIDIEGAEISLFEKNYESWLPKTRCLIIELHDRFYPGCQDRVFSAMNKYKFSHFKKGENLVFFNEELIN
ncbi:FkbM family methyltransferase [uncultured Gelidibacter sp.]|uniref:FkbM family methyltransferase n=1 Tax=uncultured Gelidibacter sp. TaxID=259318 RepID=UPI002603A6AC|nr:FkbM family methyltransferase [uncultured Gelidibacter sp.]